MIIYGEYLFAENFIVGAIILWLTGKLTGTKIRVTRLIIASSAAGFGGFIIFLNLTPLQSVFLRIATGLICTLIAMGREKIIQRLMIFFILTFASGGMVMALLLWIQKPAISHQGIIYMEALTYLKLIGFGTLAFILMHWFVKFIRASRLSIKGKVSIFIDKAHYDFNAYIDSGNSLKEPNSGNSVILIDAKGARKLPFKPLDLPKRYTLIPYKTIGMDSGFLEAIRTDMVSFAGKNSRNTYLAFYTGNFTGYEVLMNKDFLEGGTLNNE